MLLAATMPLWGQRVITTLAGRDWVFSDDGQPAVNARLGHASGIATDAAGRIYVADPDNHLVFRVSADGVLTIIAGNGIAAFSGDGGPATRASLSAPIDVALDSKGNLYIGDIGNDRVRKVTPDGIITTCAGNGLRENPGDPDRQKEEGAPASAATIWGPIGLFVDARDNLYIADGGHNQVRRVTPDGRIRTVAGNGQPGCCDDGQPATAARLWFPRDLVVDKDGNLFIADGFNHRIRKVGTDGLISTVAGTGTAGNSPDGIPAVEASLYWPFGIAVDTTGDLYVGDYSHRIRVISAQTGIISTIAGTGTAGFSGDGGPATEAALSTPSSLFIDPSGALLSTDEDNRRIRKIAGGLISTVAGNGQFREFPQGAAPGDAYLYAPEGITVTSSDELYFADRDNNRVRRISPRQQVFTAAGTGAFNCCGDGGPATSGMVAEPRDIAVGLDGNLYIADAHNNRVRRVGTDGIISTVASGSVGGIGSGDLVDPRGVALDAAGKLYIADGAGNVVRRMAPGDTPKIFAGNGDNGWSGDGGDAASARLSDPQGVTVDAMGNVYIADTGNHRIRKVTPDGVITTIAGTGKPAFSGDGRDAAGASLHQPKKIALDAAGNLYIADSMNHRIRVIDGSGVIRTIAGNGRPGFAGDGGLAADASLNEPSGVAVDRAGRVYISDTKNDRVRVVSAAPPVFDLLTISETQFTAASGGQSQSRAALTISASSDQAPAVLPFQIAFRGNWLNASTLTGITPARIEIGADAKSLGPGKYEGTITVTVAGAAGGTRTVNVVLTVYEARRRPLEVNQSAISLVAAQGSAQVTGYANVINSGSVTVPLQVSTGPESWIRASSSRESVASTAPAVLTIRAQPGSLKPGTYSSQIVVNSADPEGRITVPVTLTVISGQVMSLSKSSLVFTAVEGGSVVLPPQSFSVLRSGGRAGRWSATASTYSGRSWLSAGSDRFRSTDGVEVRVDPSGLRRGRYFGLIRIDSPDAANSPQFASVLLNVVPVGQSPGPISTPGSLVFTAVEGGSPPGSQDLLLYNTGREPISYKANFFAYDDQNWAVFRPSTGTISPDQPARITVQASSAGLGPGKRFGLLSILFQDRTVRTAGIVLTVGRTAPANRARGVPAEAACPSQDLVPVVTSAGQGIQVPAGIPAVIEAQVKDESGCPLVSGTVVAQVSTADPQQYEEVSLNSLQDGSWEGLWLTSGPQTVNITVRARLDDLTQPVSSGPVELEVGPPLPGTLAIGRVIGTASQQPGPVAPGGLISIVGAGLGPDGSLKNSVPWTSELGGATVSLGGKPLPLASVNEKQIDAIVPFGIPPDTVPQLVVAVSGYLSMIPLPAPVIVARPAIFTQDLSGTGAGWILYGGRLITSSNRAPAGGAVQIRCTGLGEVSPAVTAGTLPLRDFTITQQCYVSIGNEMVKCDYARLSSTSVGEYLVGAIVPKLPSGTHEVRLTVAGQVSPPVTMIVQ
jgi:uncharacterized protein (TIGR03437 family)